MKDEYITCPVCQASYHNLHGDEGCPHCKQAKKLKDSRRYEKLLRKNKKQKV